MHFIACIKDAGASLEDLNLRALRDFISLPGSEMREQRDLAMNEIEIGWSFLARPYWGGRYNGEMKRLMLDHAYKFVNRVLFIIGPENIRSRRAVEKIGGRLLGSRPDAQGRERVVYALDRDGRQ